MTSTQIRQSFLDFFKSKQHTIVPSSSLMPDSPNLLFTNAGMNQFVPIFLNETKCPYSPGRAADTQKCIRAGGKHNDLDDVGLDTYHHTFFEMLGNWSFGDYFKREAISWAWELVIEVWKFPPQRLYATVYCPDKTKGDPSEFDQEAWNFWAEKFRSVGLDPAVHIVNGNKKDNFWMMGDTGPCGPCSELHVDLTPAGDTRGLLVNKGTAECIEIWNLVFIQFNANADGTFSPLPAKHVDTGMGFERVTSIIQGTKNFTDFANAKISNYETDIFRPIFDELGQMSGKKYGSTLPQGSATVPVAPVGVPPTGPTRTTNPIAPSTSYAPESAARDAQQGDRDGRAPQAIAPQSQVPQVTYYKRRLPHFERPWAKYMVSFTTRERKQLSEAARAVVLKSLLFGHEQRRYQMYAACVMPDHVHFLFEPQIKEQDKDGQPVFWPLAELMHSIKSFTAHEINKLEKTTGQVWENESFDRMIRGDADLEEKFHYICRNPWDSGVAPLTENYRWLWTPDAIAEEKQSHETTKSATVLEKGSATVPVAPVGVPPTDSSRGGAARLSTVLTSHAPGAVARDAQQSDRDGRAPQTSAPHAEQIQIDIAFRVIGDHIRTLSFAIADGIQPGNTDRNYVLRRILRRAVRYGRTLGFHEPFFYKLVDVLAATMGDVFPEIRTRQQHVKDVLKLEEESFNKTLDAGIALFEEVIRLEKTLRELVENLVPHIEKIEIVAAKSFGTSEASLQSLNDIYTDVQVVAGEVRGLNRDLWFKMAEKEERSLVEAAQQLLNIVNTLFDESVPVSVREAFANEAETHIASIRTGLVTIAKRPNEFRSSAAFVLYDTYGFPLDLTELMARERGLAVDVAGFNALMEEQKARARAAQKKTVIELSQIETKTPTRFLGYDALETPARVLEVVGLKDKTAVVLDTSTCYAEMGGQLGDTGEILHVPVAADVSRLKLSDGADLRPLLRVTNTQKSGNTWLHFVEGDELPATGDTVVLRVNKSRRDAIQRHHTVTHLLHWALHEVVGQEASQKGSFVGPDKLTFDFNSAALTPAQVADIEKLVNERIVENAGVSWTEVPHADVKSRKDVMQFFGDKYGDTVRVVQIGGHATKLDGYSMELCGGTHTRATGEIGLFRIVGENAIAAGVRRIEAVAGLTAFDAMRLDRELIRTVAGKVNSPIHELEKKIELVLAHQKELEKALKTSIARNAAQTAAWLLTRVTEVNGIQLITQGFPDGDTEYLQAVVDALKSHFKGVIVLGGAANGAVALVAAVSPEFTAKIQAGKIIQQIAPIVGGKGGGKPDNARGGGKDASKLDAALAKVKELVV